LGVRSFLAIDPFSFPNAMVVHYLVYKDDIIKLAKQEVYSNNGSSNWAAGSIKKTSAAGLMKFSLSPLGATSQILTSTVLVSNTGGIRAAISWSPNPLAPNTHHSMILQACND